MIDTCIDLKKKKGVKKNKSIIISQFSQCCMRPLEELCKFMNGDQALSFPEHRSFNIFTYYI